MIKLTAKVIEALLRANGFPKYNGVLIFGFRGMLPIIQDYGYTHEVRVAGVDPDHIHPRCTLGILKGEQLFAVPGSTVPHQRYVGSALQKKGNGANQIFTGFYNDYYYKGRHPLSSPRTQHDALRLSKAVAIRRTADDLDYDGDDRIEYENPYNNIHAAWCNDEHSDYFASAGCQVVCGKPKCKARGNQPNTGAWAVFQKNVYSEQQNTFTYMLLNGYDVVRLNREGSMLQRARFGSVSQLTIKVQNALSKRGHYRGKIDGVFGYNTLAAVVAFQEKVFGMDSDDGIVGPNTAKALEIELVKIHL